MSKIKVQVIYALPKSQDAITVDIEEGATVQEAITASDIISHYPELELSILQVGIYSQKVPLTHIVKSGDRIEIYRPLIIDPKTARRKRI